jgi:N-acylneuraminate cytidylyltransferase
VSSEGNEMVRCNRSDGYSFEILRKLGLQIFILSSEKNDVVKKRGEKLKIKTISGSKDKKRDLLRLCKNYGLSPKRLIYVGNDINDIDVMRICGLSFAVNDAVEKVKKAADIVLTSNGGEMVAREILNNYLEY